MLSCLFIYFQIGKHNFQTCAFIYQCIAHCISVYMCFSGKLPFFFFPYSETLSLIRQDSCQQFSVCMSWDDIVTWWTWAVSLAKLIASSDKVEKDLAAEISLFILYLLLVKNLKKILIWNLESLEVCGFTWWIKALLSSYYPFSDIEEKC